MAVNEKTIQSINGSWNPTSTQQTVAQTNAAQTNAAQTTSATPQQLNFVLSTSKSMFLYRLGIGELQFNPKNMQLGESISSKLNVEDGIYGKTNPFVSYVNTTRSFSIAFLLPADNAGFRIVADANSPITTYSQNNGAGGVVPFMNVIKSFLYANYSTTREEAGGNSRLVSRTIKSPPIFKLLNKSIISNGDFPAAAEIGEESIAKQYGLLGFIKDFKLDPLFGIGYVPFSPTGQQVINNDTASAFDTGGNFKEVKISFTFIPIFEEGLGWDTENNNFSGVKELGGIQSGTNVISKILRK